MLKSMINMVIIIYFYSSGVLTRLPMWELKLTLTVMPVFVLNSLLLEF